jgi:hypothetical protein
MPGNEPPRPGPEEPQKPSDNRAVLIIGTIVWAVTTFLPVVFPRIPPVPETTPAFIAFLGATLAVPEVRKFRSRGKDDR